MALGKEIGDFSFKLTSTTFAEDGSSIQLNYDGEATGFGTVLGTLYGRGEPGAKQGTCSWRAEGFLDDGNQVMGGGEGTWQEVGKHRWRVRAINQTSDGQSFASDGIIDLASRSFKGKLIEWD
jgi:hypothetical protein